MVQCVCVIRSGGDIKGTLILEQESEDTPTVIKGEISGLATGKHGISLHVFGDISDGAKRIGEHFNPFGKNHGAPGDDERHVGSLGNITADTSKVAKVHIEDKLVKLIGPFSIIGRSIGIGENPDDLGKGGTAESLKTGNVGEIIAHGVVGIGCGK